MFNPPEEYLEAEKGLKETKWKRERTNEDMKREQDLLTRARFNYEKKKQELLRFLAKGSSNVSSQVMQPSHLHLHIHIGRMVCCMNVDLAGINFEEYDLFFM